MIDSEPASEPPAIWRHRSGTIDLRTPWVLAILNLTPDSFHDGGQLHRAGVVDASAVQRAARAAQDEGAGMLDLGGESTRPGANPVDPSQERARVLEGERAVREAGITLPWSCDTRRACVAQAALEAGADVINDVSGLADPAMAAVVARHGAGLVIGHMRGVPQTMQQTIAFADLLDEIGQELSDAIEHAVREGVPKEHIVVDPGIGFGKSPEHSAALVASSRNLARATGCAVMIGASRKSFIGALDGSSSAQRLPGSLAAAVVAARHGAAILRVHDVGPTVQALRVAAAIESQYARVEAVSSGAAT